MPQESKWGPGRVAIWLWYGFFVLILLAVLAKYVPTGDLNPELLHAAIFGTGLLLLFGCFVLLHLVFRGVLKPPLAPITSASVPQSVGAFPSPATIGTGVWLLLLTGISLVGVLWSLDTPPEWVPVLFGTGVTNAVIMMFAATLGSLITTILGYLEHASVKKDFELAFVPWYLGRPLMGMLLGLVFYFVIEGGLLMVTKASSEELPELSKYGLAGVAALVGLFSKNAIAKLREIFQNLFRTEDDMVARILDRLPPDLRSAVAEALKKPQPSPTPTPSPVSQASKGAGGP